MGSAKHDDKTRLRIALVGTRGVPAAYGGFETAVEEIGRRLAASGHDVVVYSRGGEERMKEYLGMRVVHLPALPVKQAETLSHTGLSTLHAWTHRAPDVAFVFNAANSPFVPLLRARGIPVALHMDGIEWKRSKWGGRGRAYYRWAEQFGVRTADALISDAPGIADYYVEEFDAPTELLRYGAPILTDTPVEPITSMGLTPGGYHLVVARFEPENHVREIVQGYHASAATLPLIVVGSAPYAAEYTREIAKAAESDERIRLVGGVFDQDLLDALYAHAATYLHGHSVGGTNPSLLRAMGASTAVTAFDVGFNRETLGDIGRFFRTADEARAMIEESERDLDAIAEEGMRVQQRAQTHFRWDDVAAAYDKLAWRLAAGESVHPALRRARRRSDASAAGSALDTHPSRDVATPRS